VACELEQVARVAAAALVQRARRTAEQLVGLGPGEWADGDDGRAPRGQRPAGQDDERVVVGRRVVLVDDQDAPVGARQVLEQPRLADARLAVQDDAGAARILQRLGDQMQFTFADAADANPWTLAKPGFPLVVRLPCSREGLSESSPSSKEQQCASS
jgi:hypothetical protein